MDGSRIQSLVYRGYALSAARVGLPYQHYQPSGPSNPLAPANLLGMLPAAFSVDRYKFQREDGYGTPEHQALVDGSQIVVGDYLVGPSGTYFIGALNPLVPILAIECNGVLSFTRPGVATPGFGAVGYGQADPGTALLTAWPASLLQGTKGEKADDGLPRDSRQPWYAALLPAVGGAEIRTDDEAVDARGHRYTVSSAELTDKGWRLSLAYAGT
ncbi:MAG: hypothetical protein ACRYG8_03440 [Janthinobacterium lividum]